MTKAIFAFCIVLVACLLVSAKFEGGDQATTQEAIAPVADSRPANMSVSQPMRAALLTGSDHPMKASFPELGVATIRVAPKLSDKFVRNELSKSDVKVVADPETLKKAVEDEVSISAKASGKTIEEFLKKVDGATITSKIDLLVENAKKQLETKGSLATFKKELAAYYEKDAGEIVGAVKAPFPTVICVTGLYSLNEKKWRAVGNSITFSGALTRRVPTKFKLASTIDLSESVGSKFVVPVSEVINLSLTPSITLSGEPDLKDVTNTTTELTVAPVATIKVTSTISDQKGLAVNLEASITKDLGAVKAVLTRGQVLPTKVVEIDATPSGNTDASKN